MKKSLKWTGIVVGGLVGVGLLGIAWAHFASERAIDQHFVAHDETPLQIPTDAISIAEGKRIADLAGCLDCHGEKLNGRLVDDIPGLVRLVAPNISVLLPEYSDAQLAIVLRQGVKPDGKSVVFMPSEMYRHLSDQDLAQLIAFLRTVPVTREGVQEKTELRLLARALLAKGDFKVAAESIPTFAAPATSFDAADPVSHGKHLTMSFCSECHGQNLEGFAPINAPPLVVAKAYGRDQFATLLHDGTPIGGRELRIMGYVAKARFAHFTNDEVSAIHAYLHSRG